MVRVVTRVVNLADERERRRGDTRLAELDPLPAVAGEGRGWPALQEELTEVPDLHVVSEERAPNRLLGPDGARSSGTTQLGLFDGDAS